MSPSPAPVVLASGSVHRRELLARLQLEFRCCPPDIDETARPGEAPRALAVRLAAAKARAVAARNDLAMPPGTLVIGSDQVAECAGSVLGKPGNRARAAEQLSQAAGREVRFHTAATVVVTGSERELSYVDLTTVRFRQFDTGTVAAYLDRESALDCAGAFKSEGLGIALVERLHTDDPTALIGLPLIWLCDALRELGVAVPPA